MKTSSGSFRGNHVCKDQHITVFADARLTNPEEIARLTSADASVSHCELILHAYKKWRQDCVRYLQGDFAFCVLDGEQVFCARDRIGAKPFYYGIQDDQFVFASEARPVADVIGLSISEQRIADFLMFPMEHVDLTSTFYQGVSRLPPATTMTVSEGVPRFNCYWQPEYAPVEDWRDEDCVEQFLELIDQAIRQRVDDEFAISLSGGLDSSLLSGVASQHMTVKSFSTVADPDVEEDESEYIRLLASQQNIDATLIGLDRMHEMDAWLSSQFSQLAEPFDFNMLQMLIVYRAAAESGSTIVGDGVEGDLTYALPASYPAVLCRSGHWVSGVREMLGERRHSYGAPHSYFSVARNLLKSLRPESTRREVLNTDTEWIRPDFARECNVFERRRNMHKQHRSLNDAVQYRVVHPAITAALERYDRIAAQAGVEAIHPLLDSRLIEFSLRLPWYFRNRDGWQKYLIRMAGKGLVPDKVRWQTNKPENAWLFNERYLERHRSEMQSMIDGHRQSLAQYVPTSVLDDPDDGALWSLYALSSWLDRH